MTENLAARFQTDCTRAETDETGNRTNAGDDTNTEMRGAPSMMEVSPRPIAECFEPGGRRLH